MRSHAKASSAGSTLRQAIGLGRLDRGAFAGRARSLDADGRGAPSLGIAGLGALMALCLLVFAPGALAAKIPGGEPLAIFGPEAGTCDATKTTTAIGTGDVTSAGATGKGDRAILAKGTGTVTVDSQKITNVNTTTGEFKVGEEILAGDTETTAFGPGTTIIAIDGPTLTASRPAASMGTRTLNLTSGSKTLTNVATETGAFAVGQSIAGPGIAHETFEGSGEFVENRITAVGAGTLTLTLGVASAGTGGSLTATSTKVTNLSISCGAFKIGQEVSGAGMPTGTVITAVGTGTFILPKAPIAEGTGVALTSTTRFGSLISPSSLAVDEAGRRLYIFDALFSPLAARKLSAFNLPSLAGSVAGFPLTPPVGFGFASPIAVDNTGLTSSRRLYFADSAAGNVYAFKPDGTELNLGNGFPNFPLALPFLGPGSPISSDPCGATVDSNGNLWIGDSAQYGTSAEPFHVVRKYSSTGVLLDTIEIPTTQFFGSGGRPSCGLAVDDEGNLYVVGHYQQGHLGIWMYSAASEYDPLLATTLGASGISIALDKNRDLIYTTRKWGLYGDKVEVRTLDGALLGDFAEGISTELASVAFDETGQRVFVADQESGQIYAFGFVDTPDVTTGVAVGSDATHQTLRGQVNPLSNEVEDCSFEYTLESEFAIFGWSHAASTPCAEELGLGSSPVDVSAELSGLPPATKYRVRATAENANGRTIGATKTFTTKGPVVSEESVSEVTATSARLEATINPNGEGTSYRFEYVGDADFEDSGWAKGISVPAGVAGVGSGNADVQVSRQITGLAPGESYRFRAVATNASATLGGRGSALTTVLQDGTDCTNDAQRSGTSAHLSECRAYEQVSPIEKGGYDIEPRWPVISSPDGEDVAYSSTGAFGDSEIAGLPVAYVARHGGEEWQSEGVSAPVDPVGDAFMGMVYGVSEDLGIQLVGTNAKLTPDAPENGFQLYVHRSADDSYQYVATTPVGEADTFFPMGGAPLRVTYVGASADGSSVFFSGLGLADKSGELPGFSLPSTPPPPATAKNNLYEFDTVSGQLKLVGVLPDDTTVEPKGSRAPHVSYPAPALSQAAIKESIVSSHPVSRDGSVYWEGGGSLYRRENGHSTLIALGSPEFQGATPDGSFAFYQVGGSLKRYDAADESSIDLDVESFRVFGFSDDGEYVYFLSHGAYAPGSFPAPGGAANLFVWHDGDVRLIARLAEADDFLFGNRSVKWRVSGNGRYLGFLTGNPLQGRDFSFARQPDNPSSDVNGPYLRAFFYDYLADSLACASCPTDDESSTPDGNVMLKPPPAPAGLQTFNQFHEESRNVTDTGQFFFSTPESLVDEDANGKYDVYEYRSGGVSLISTGQSNDDSWFGDATPDGDAVFFTTREGLVEQDKDPNVDLYVARVNGGLASQRTSAQGAVCQDAEQCGGAPTTAPSTPGPGTSAFEAPPQAKAPVRRCKAGKVKRKGRCVKPRKKQRRKPAKRAAGNERRASR